MKSSWSVPLGIILTIIAANFLYLSNIVNPNPINTTSGLVNTSTYKQPYFSGHNVIDPNGGFGVQALGKQSVEDVIHGHFPWWNYNEQVGAPLAGEMQSAALFPLTAILGASNGMTYLHVVLEIIAGLSTYYLLLRLGLRRLSASVGALAFGLSSVFAWFWSANTTPVAFLPMLVLGVEIAFTRAKDKKNNGWLIIAIALAMSIYSGFPEVTFIDGLLAFCWAAVRLFQADSVFRRAYISKISLGAIIGLLISAPLIISFLDYLPYADVGPHGSAILTIISSIGIPALFMPYTYGEIFGLFAFDPTSKLMNFWSNIGGYATALTFFMSMTGLFIGLRKKSKDKPIKILLGIWSLVITLRIYGLLGTAQIFGKIPGISETAIYRYSQPSLNFALSVLLAYGLNYIISGKLKKINIKYIGIIAAFMILVIAIVFPIALTEIHNIIGSHHQSSWMFVSFAWAILSVMGAFILVYIGYSRTLKLKITNYLLALLVLIDVIVMFVIPQISAPRAATIDTSPVVYLQKNLADYRFYSLGPIMPNYGAYFNISSIDTNNSPISKNWAKYIISNLDSNAIPLTFVGLSGNSVNPLIETPTQAFFQNILNYEYLGVKYLVVTRGSINQSQISSSNLSLVFSDNNNIQIYRLPDPQPYFKIIKGDCTINYVNKTNVTADCTSRSTLLRRELYMSGWTIKTDRDPTIINKSGPLFQSVNLPVGKSNLEFNFTPKYMDIGYLSFICGITLVVGIYYLNRSRD
jgi:hypothetical protein